MIHSFLMIGQSNMAGRGFINDVPPIYNERIRMLRNGLFQFMEEPINYDRSIAGVSLAASFAAAWCKKNKQQDEIGLIPCAEGGSSLDDWSVDGALFANAIAQTKLAQRVSTLDGIIWHQGEAESHSGKYHDYCDKFFIIIERLRQELNVPEIPLIIGGLGDYLGDSIFGHFDEYNLVNEELKRFAHSYNNCYYVTAKGLTSNPDGIHLNAVSQRIFGLRYFEAYDQKCHIPVPVKNEDKAIQIDSDRPHTKTEKAQMINILFFGGKISFEEYKQKMSQTICE